MEQNKENEENDKKLISNIINEEILNKLEKTVETMEPSSLAKASTESIEDYKINILVTTICHGEKIILRPLVSFDDFVDNYMRELARQSWYPFVRKTYKYGYAPFGNVCIFRSTPTDPWSKIDNKKNIEEGIRSLGPSPNFSSRKDAASNVKQVWASYINQPKPGKLTEAEIEGKKRGAVMGKMVKTFSNMDPKEFPVKAIMNPLKMRLEVIPTVYSLSGKNTDRQEEEFQKVPNFFGISGDFYSGIFTSILSDNRDNVFTFSSLLNLADGKHITEIYQKLSDESREAIFGPGNPIPIGIDCSELYYLFKKYIDYWNGLTSPRESEKDNEKIKNDKTYIPHIRSPLLEIGWQLNTYYIKDKDGRPRPKSYFILTQMNTMNVYILANLVFDFLLFKKNNRGAEYRIKTEEQLVSWIEELKNKKSKIINISDACESVVPNTMSEQLINDASKYINEISIRQTPTQQAMEETGEPDIIPFDELDKYISQFESVEDDKKGGKGKKNRNRNKNKQKGGNLVYEYNPQDPNTTKLLSIIETEKRAEEVKIGGNRSTKKRHTKRSHTKKRHTKKRRTNKYK